jgi:hypothetical protein
MAQLSALSAAPVTAANVAYRIAAVVLAASHFAISVFAVLGAFLVAIDPAWMWMHVPVVLWIFAMNLFDWTCPLTTWEHACLRRAVETRGAGFIRHYVGRTLHYRGNPRRLEMIIGTVIFLWNEVLYLMIFFRQQ